MPSVIVYLRGFHFLSALVRLLLALLVGTAIGAGAGPGESPVPHPKHAGYPGR